MICPATPRLSTIALIDLLRDARARTLQLLSGLGPRDLLGPRLDVVNPLLWEVGHVAWFHERFILRDVDGCAPLLADPDALYDSIQIPHDARWELPLPSLAETRGYLEAVLAALIARLGDGLASETDSYLYQLTTFHEDMHTEALIWSRQALAHPTPSILGASGPGRSGPLPGDVEIPGGRHLLGAAPGADRFVFDNERPGHEVQIAPFRIARAPVTNAEFAQFVDDGGYLASELWDEAGWRWRRAAGADHPVYWTRGPSGWHERRFDRMVPIGPHRPVIHVNWHEARAYCRWAGRRLPTEAEWEAAASGGPCPPGRNRPRFPWGDAPPDRARANLDGLSLGCTDVAALPGGDSPQGCRQLIGNVWEWTESRFAPYPGFQADVYREYSEPWFGGGRRVLRGGCWATRGRLLSNAHRNFFPPERRDILAGFRTCEG